MFAARDENHRIIEVEFVEDTLGELLYAGFDSKSWAMRRTAKNDWVRRADTPLATNPHGGIEWGFSRGVAQPGRALGSGPRGRRFKSSRPDQLFSSNSQHSLLRGFLWFPRYPGCDGGIRTDVIPPNMSSEQDCWSDEF